MVLLAVIASKDPQFALVERRCMVLDLGSTTYDRTEHGLRGDRLICAPVLGGTADLVVGSVGCHNANRPLSRSQAHLLAARA